MRMTSSTIAVALALAATAVAPAARADEEPDPQHGVSITFSPLHLILPAFELQAEFKVNPTLGVAAIGAIGSASVSVSDGESTTSSSFTLWELGAKVAWYAVGDFEEGFQIGLEALYLGVSGDASDELSSASVFASGFSLSPYIGYKIVADVGFTFEGQLGPAFVFATASAEDGDGSSSASVFGVGLMLNLNIGWSL